MIYEVETLNVVAATREVATQGRRRRLVPRFTIGWSGEQKFTFPTTPILS